MFLKGELLSLTSKAEFSRNFLRNNLSDDSFDDNNDGLRHLLRGVRLAQRRNVDELNKIKTIFLSN